MTYHFTAQTAVAVTFQTCILEVTGASLGWATSYPEWNLPCSSLLFPSKFRGKVYSVNSCRYV